MASYREESAREIARRVGRSLHHVIYAIRSRQIRPSRKVGNINLFGGDAIERIEAALREITIRNEAMAGTTAEVTDAG